MNSIAPDLGGLVPYVSVFIAVGVAGAAASLAILAQAAATFAHARRHHRVVRPDCVLAPGRLI
jgi:hypothetical protein